MKVRLWQTMFSIEERKNWHKYTALLKVIDFLRGERYDMVVIKKKASFVRTPLLTPFSFSFYK